MNKVEDFMNCIFEKKDGWAYSYNSYTEDYSEYSLQYYIKYDIEVNIYPYIKNVKYNNFLGRYLGLGEDEIFFSYSIEKKGRSIQYFNPKDIYEFRDKVYKKLKEIKFKRTLNRLKERKELINSLEC